MGVVWMGLSWAVAIGMVGGVKGVREAFVVCVVNTGVMGFGGEQEG
jgi:hypothetical protein